MPWFTHEAAVITPEEIDSLTLRLLDEARARIKRDLRRVLLLLGKRGVPAVGATDWIKCGFNGQ